MIPHRDGHVLQSKRRSEGRRVVHVAIELLHALDVGARGSGDASQIIDDMVKAGSLEMVSFHSYKRI